MKHLTHLTIVFLIIFSSLYAEEKITSIKDVEFAPHKIKADTFLEYWALTFQFDDGSSLYNQFITTSKGVINGTAMVLNNFAVPSKKTLQLKDEFTDKDLKFDTAKQKLSLGKNQIIKSGSTYILHVENDKLTADIKLVSNSMGFQINDGFAYPDKTSKNTFVKTFNHVPFGTASGTIKYADGKTLNIKGFGTIEHGYSNELQPTYSKLWERFRLLSSDFAITMTDITASDKFKNTSMPQLIIAEKGKEPCAASDYKLTKSVYKKDGDNKYPTVFTLNATCGNYTIEGKWHTTKLNEKYEALQGMSWPVRKIAAMVAGEVTFYRSQNEYSFTITSKEKPEPVKLNGSGINETIFMK